MCGRVLAKLVSSRFRCVRWLYRAGPAVTDRAGPRRAVLDRAAPRRTGLDRAAAGSSSQPSVAPGTVQLASGSHSGGSGGARSDSERCPDASPGQADASSHTPESLGELVSIAAEHCVTCEDEAGPSFASVFF